MNNQTTNQTTNQNVGGMNMDKLVPIINLFKALSVEEQQALVVAICKGSVASVPQPQAPVSNGMVEIAPETLNGMVQQIAQLQAQVEQLVQAQQQPVYQAPQFDFAAQGTVDMDAINQAVYQQQMQQQMQAQTPGMDVNTLARIRDLEIAIERKAIGIQNQAQRGFTTYSATAELQRMQQELAKLKGTGIVNRVTNAVNTVSQYGQDKIVNGLVPNMGNATADLVANGGNVVANAVANGGQWLANGAQWLAQGVQLGTNTVAQGVPVVTGFVQQTANAGLNLGIK